MKQAERYRDIDIRIRLLEYLNRAYSGVEHFIALEARYAHSERRADVLVVANHTHAYEIKSDFDKLNRLPEQLKDYKKTFDFVTVVTTKPHLQKVKKMLGKNDGLIIISDQGVDEIKIPKRNKRIERRNLVSMCSKAVLAHYLGVSYGALPLEVMRTKAVRKLPLSVLEEAFRSELKRRFKYKYDIFQEEACIPYRESDLLLLRQNKRLSTNFPLF